METDFGFKKEAHSDAAPHIEAGAGGEGQSGSCLAEELDSPAHQIEPEVAAAAGDDIVADAFRLVVPDTDKAAGAVIKMDVFG